jgi:hypothetical protein
MPLEFGDGSGNFIARARRRDLVALDIGGVEGGQQLL